MSTSATSEHSLVGKTVRSTDHRKIGAVRAVHLDDHDMPTWAVVHTGVVTTATTLVPLGDAVVRGSDIFVPFDKSLVAEAPPTDVESSLSDADARQLLDYYEVRTPTSDLDVDDTPYSSDTI